MSLRFILPALLLCIFLSPSLKSQEILKGYVSVEDLSDQSPLFDVYIDRYQPAPEVVADLSRIGSEIHIRVFMATWCKESIRYIPELVRVLRDAGNANITTTFIALGYPREDVTGTLDDHKIENIPTLIVEAEGREIGRIVEKPDVSMESDLWRILKGFQKMH